MIKKSDLETVIHLQKERFLKSTDEIERELLQLLPLSLSNHALIISGVRRCGKSTLIKQLVNQEPSDAFYINFDTPKLYEFEINDFEVLDQIIYTANPKKLYFDEIQVVLGWELYVRQKLDEGYQVLVTGSNASLLSKELGTKLTGRHITKELFPFSYVEFIRFKKIESGIDSFRSYFRLGGFPEYVKHESRKY